MVVAELSGKKVEEVSGANKKSPTLPVLECENGEIANSMAIAKFLSSKELKGSTPFESAQVDQWLQTIRNDFIPLARCISYLIFGHIPFDQALFN